MNKQHKEAEKLQKERQDRDIAASWEFAPEQRNQKTNARGRGLETEADVKLLTQKLEVWARSLMLRK
jgi:hypothetical protein